MKLPGWLVPWRKATDLNTVTPIRDTLRVPSRFGWITEAFGGAWQSGLVLESTANVLAFSAVYACVALIAGDISKLGRPKLMRLAPDGVWDVVTQSPFLTVLRKPNRFQTWIQFLAHWLASKYIHGNTYVLIERDNRGGIERTVGVPRALYILDPRGVQPVVAPDGEVYYKLSKDWLSGLKEGDDLYVPATEIIHDRHVTLWHPLVGVSPIYACGASATQGIRIQSNSQAFFSNMSRPSGHLTTPGKISDETAARIKTEFETKFSGTNLGRLLVTGDDLKFQPFTIPAQDSQLIEQLGFTVEDVARAYGVPLYKVQAGAMPTISNLAALNQEYYSQVLQNPIESIELLLDEALGLPEQGMGVELDLEKLLRMDPVSRADVTDKRIKAGMLAPNEARAAENMHPVDGGESPMAQQQNYSLAALKKRDARPDPFATGTPAAPAPTEKPAAANDEISAEDAAAAKASARRALRESFEKGMAA